FIYHSTQTTPFGTVTKTVPGDVCWAVGPALRPSRRQPPRGHGCSCGRAAAFGPLRCHTRPLSSVVLQRDAQLPRGCPAQRSSARRGRGYGGGFARRTPAPALGAANR